MSEFKIRDIAIVVETGPSHAHLKGMECEIIRGLNMDGEYLIEVRGNPFPMVFFAEPCTLRKKNPPLGSWLLIETITGWSPYRVNG